MASRIFILACVVCAIGAARVVAEDPTPSAAPTSAGPDTVVPAQPPAVAPDALLPISPIEATTEPATQGSLLGDRVESKTFGLAFRPPANLTEQEKAADDPNVIAQFIGADGASLKVTRLINGNPMELVGKRAKDDTFTPGLCDYVIEQMKAATPGVQTEREDIVSVGDYDCGVIVMRFELGTQRWLRQQAFLQVNKKVYYVLNYTVPTNTTDPAHLDPNDQIAANTFDQMINSQEVLDLRPIREDQDLRLIHTRALFVLWQPDVLKKALVAEQWNRILKDGRDIGYSYVVQEATRSGSNDGIRVSIRTRTINDGQQLDVGSQSFVSLDRRTENWEQVVTVRKAGDDKANNQDIQMGAVFGTSLHQMNNLTEIQQQQDPKQPVIGEKITVDVTHMGKTGDAQPMSCEAAPWYVPTALTELLPWILPLDKPKGYMMQCYVAEQRNLMNRYVDVGALESVVLNGQKILAVPVTDRVGLEGKPIIHYMSIDGKYLGSMIPSQHLTVVPSDKDTLLKIWKNANLTKPAIKRPGEATTEPQ